LAPASHPAKVAEWPKMAVEVAPAQDALVPAQDATAKLFAVPA